MTTLTFGIIRTFSIERGAMESAIRGPDRNAHLVTDDNPLRDLFDPLYI
jgi:hypothetical protein